jgi:hypothetical protein
MHACEETLIKDPDLTGVEIASRSIRLILQVTKSGFLAQC